MAHSAAATPAVQLRPSAGTRDRAFYTGIAIAMLLTVFTGFYRSYYLRPMFNSQPLLPILHIHGLLFSTWIVLFIAQPSLIAVRRVDIHRKLGYAGAVLAGLMVIVGVTTAIVRARQGAAPPGADPRAFLVVPLGDMLVFGTMVAAGVWLRRNKEAHKRLLIVATATIMAAPIARLPHVLEFGPLAFFGLADLFVLAGILYDYASKRRVHPAYIWGGLFLVASQPLRLMLAKTDLWMGFAGWLIR